MADIRYFAVIARNRVGYVLDYYSGDEELSYRNELGEMIIGAFDTPKKAEAAIATFLKRDQKL